MNKLNRAIDRFCYKHPRFGIPNLMLFIVIGTLIVFLFGLMDRTNTFLQYLAFSPALILRGQVWRLITFLFVPSYGNIFTFAISLYFYYFIGSTLERYWGTGRFTIYYFSAVILTVIFGFVVWALTGAYSLGLDVSFLNLSLFFAFAVLFPDTRVLLFFFIPIKIKWLAIIDALFFVYALIAYPFPMNLLPLVSVLNFFLFCGGTLFGYLRRRRPAGTPQAAQFRRESRRAKQQEAARTYRHKCEVCGRTDTDHPDLEFRYCSRCAGYHCFCIDHINSHVHFTE